MLSNPASCGRNKRQANAAANDDIKKLLKRIERETKAKT
jgi:hypothetical protein